MTRFVRLMLYTDTHHNVTKLCPFLTKFLFRHPECPFVGYTVIGCTVVCFWRWTKILWTKRPKFAIVPLRGIIDSVTDMILPNFPLLWVLFVLAVFAAGCSGQGNHAQPSNPFAQNLKTVPPPATFSSQESYLGQTPGSFIPQTPATTFSSHSPGSASSAQPGVPPSDAALSGSGTAGGEKATVFTSSEQETAWAPAAVAATSQTAFQAVQAKVDPDSPGNATLVGGSETLIVGASHTVTTITDESQPAPALSTPQPLYSGNF